MALTHVEIVTPEGALFSGQAEMMVCRTEGGDIAFLANHMPYVGQLQPGELRVVHPEGSADGAELRFEVGGGFVEVCDNRVVAACDSAKKVA
jgi:F-type H+-transporting ATPase subunit epsilon